MYAEDKRFENARELINFFLTDRQFRTKNPFTANHVGQLAFFAFNAFNLFANARATHQLGNQLFMRLRNFDFPLGCLRCLLDERVQHDDATPNQRAKENPRDPFGTFEPHFERLS